jgi:hypothetical protein
MRVLLTYNPSRFIVGVPLGLPARVNDSARSKRGAARMKTTSWFEVLTLVMISLMSVASGVATDAGLIEAQPVSQLGAGQR